MQNLVSFTSKSKLSTARYGEPQRIDIVCDCSNQASLEVVKVLQFHSLIFSPLR